MNLYFPDRPHKWLIVQCKHQNGSNIWPLYISSILFMISATTFKVKWTTYKKNHGLDIKTIAPLILKEDMLPVIIITAPKMFFFIWPTTGSPLSLPSLVGHEAFATHTETIFYLKIVKTIHILRGKVKISTVYK